MAEHLIEQKKVSEHYSVLQGSSDLAEVLPLFLPSPGPPVAELFHLSAELLELLPLVGIQNAIQEVQELCALAGTRYCESCLFVCHPLCGFSQLGLCFRAIDGLEGIDGLLIVILGLHERLAFFFCLFELLLLKFPNLVPLVLGEI